MASRDKERKAEVAAPTLVGAEAARADFADLLDRVRMSGERIVVTRYGRAVAVIVPPDAIDIEAAKSAA